MCVLCWWRRVSFLLLCLIVKEWSGNLFNVTESPHRKVWSFRITLSPSGLNRFFHGTSMIVIFRVKSHQIWPMISPMPMFHTKQSIGSMTLFVRELLNSYIAMKIPFQRRRFPQNLLILQGSPTSAASPSYLSICHQPDPQLGEIPRCSWRMPSIPRAQPTRWRFKLLDEQPRRRLNMKRRSGNYVRRIGSLDCGDVQLCGVHSPNFQAIRMFRVESISPNYICRYSTLFQAVAEVFENLLRDRNW